MRRKMDFLKRLFSAKPKGGSGVDNSRLVQAMHELAIADTPQGRETLYNLLLTAKIIIPTPEIPADIKPSAATKSTGTTKVEVIGLTGKEQQRITPIFTDLEALHNWDPNTPSLIMPARAFFQMIGTLSFDEVIINPFDPIRKMLRPGGILKRFEFEALAGGFIPGCLDGSGTGVPMTIPKGQQVSVGVPDAPPRDAVLSSVIAAAKTMSEINELYLFQMAMDSAEARIAVGVDLTQKASPERKQEIVRGLAADAHKLLQKGEYLDFMIMDSSLAETIRQRGKRLLHP
jgi:hypothetical protein